MHIDHFEQSGYVILPALLDAAALRSVDAALHGRTASAPGARQMLQLDWCAALAAILHDRLVAAALMPADYVAVQCTFFEKSRSHNWLVAPHQDLSIPVRDRIDHAALRGWSDKDGMLFVQPPVAVLAQLVALRLHVDDCARDDGALRVVPGSHHRGRLEEAGKGPLREELGDVLSPVRAGNGMAMRPLLLHASSRATGASRRRVLHFVFGPPVLPHGLVWASHDNVGVKSDIATRPQP